MVPPTERRDRSTICTDHGKPMRRCSSRVSCAISHPDHVVRRVHPQQVGPGGGMRFMQLLDGEDAVLDDACPQPGVLVHREAVPVGKGQHEVIAIERVHAGTAGTQGRSAFVRAAALNALRAARIVSSTSRVACAPERNHASNCEGGR